MSNSDLQIVRDLARRVAEVAAFPVMEERRRQWYRHNALQPGKPMIFCSPEGSWVELLPTEALQCQEEPYRTWEHVLRARLYCWEHFADDQVMDDRLIVGKAARLTGWGLEPDYQHSGTERRHGKYVVDRLDA